MGAVDPEAAAVLEVSVLVGGGVDEVGFDVMSKNRFGFTASVAPKLSAVGAPKAGLDDISVNGFAPNERLNGVLDATEDPNMPVEPDPSVNEGRVDLAGASPESVAFLFDEGSSRDGLEAVSSAEKGVSIRFGSPSASLGRGANPGVVPSDELDGTIPK
jgi:hypothetical protein